MSAVVYLSSARALIDYAVQRAFAHTTMTAPLSSQFVVPSPPAEKIKLSLLSLATVDALGGPVEFKRRGTFPLVGVMRTNNNFGGLPPGTWTDDTSMTLCLAHSLATSNTSRIIGSNAKGGFNEIHQLEAYSSWHQKGFLSCTGECFDVGNTIRQALYIYQGYETNTALEEIAKQLSREESRGNGSLMRVLPIGLAYWSLGEDKAAEFARRSSCTTHPEDMCLEACEIYTRMIVWVISHSSQSQPLSKLDLLQRVSQLPIRNQALRDKLCIPPPPADCTSVEDYYMQNHPFLQLASQYPGSPNPKTGIPAIPPVSALPSSGYVLDTLNAALYAFFATDSFDMGALLTVNLGSDADTVGAVYGGLAGTWYASQEDSRFWTMKTRDWVDVLQNKDMIEEVATRLVKYEEKVRSKQAVDV